ncbi:MAG: DUF2156 domain-containing protein [bacterium]|nr:DUF2156 domain-containing protein [bacterium]
MKIEDRVLALLKLHSRHTTSFQILEPGYRYWFDGDDACVAYADTGRAWVAAGVPVAPERRLAAVTRRFIEAAEAHGRKARFFGVDEAFAATTGLQRTHIGEEPYWDPSAWDRVLASSKNLREQLRRARAKGIALRPVAANEISDLQSPTRTGIDVLIARWIASHALSEMKFMVLVHPFSHPEERRYVVAERDGVVIGFAAAVPVYGLEGWFVEDVIRDPDAPNGTAESLVDAMMRLLAAEGSRTATLGLAPLAGEVNTALRLTRNYTAALYNFGGVRAFKEKLRPARWEPVYLAYPHDHLGLWAIRDVLSAFAPGGLLRFGLNTLIHERGLATFGLCALLTPWTIAIALAPEGIWFPSRAVQLGWVGFDVVLIALLATLVQRWRPWLANFLFLLTTLDAGLTLLQFLTWNLTRTHGLGSWLLVVAGVLGPLIASAFFLATRRVAM